MKLVFLHTSDLHGYVLPTDYQIKNNYQAPFSLSRVNSVIKQEREKYGTENVIVTDAGDFLQGSPLAAYVHENSQDNLVRYANIYNCVGYDARVLGNHDFDFGTDYLKQCLAYANDSFINANIVAERTNLPAFDLAPFKIIEKRGVKVGLIGCTTQYVPNWESKEKLAGLKFVSAYEQVKAVAQKLRSQVDVLAVVYHGGFESDPATGRATQPHNGENEAYRILKEVPGIDMLLTGHQHQRISLVDKGTAIVQSGYRGETVAEVVLDIDDKTKKISAMTTRLIDTREVNPDSEVLHACKDLEWETQVWLDRPIAILDKPAKIKNATAARLHGSPFINLLQQMQLYFTKADISATALMSETAHGFDKQVTMRDLILNYPYSNQLCCVRVTGRELRHVIEHSLAFLTKDQAGKVAFADKYIRPHSLLFNFDLFYPINYQANISRPVGRRLTSLTFHGEEIVADQVYHLAVNNYRAMGGGFYPEYSKDKIEFTLDKDYIQMFQEYLTSGLVNVDDVSNYHFY
ncbi:bifunctional UDP-sugar hydrolase/5'-nucleotidase [Lactobacillus sp. ESL0791]|uniref:bifunctional metallophosphatase/5'-nucleotidase n=1 Tax=Lactobacillus sp. ESL0791 TaxID=2983234 RepID=UPI0023F921F2|nr:bifunctional UDP-sugar hydrolase/5'-nucleotidase [Lactobacillus sp. ESL0791]MDF7638860.1 bifunctional UDP-sugar hydrolase/5'-nucleotidase [Lactobacillus sp. ESL0791]